MANQFRTRVKQLRLVKAADLIPHEQNWRKHTSEQRKVLNSLLDEVGIADALIARELPDGRLQLLDGHLRADLDKRAAWPVLITDLEEAEGAKLLLTLDPLAAMAEGDQAAVEALLKSVQTDSAAVAGLLERVAGEAAWQALREPEDLTEVPARIDQAAELRAKWGTAPGQTWAAGPHRLMCGDCREEAVVGVCGVAVRRKSS